MELSRRGFLATAGAVSLGFVGLKSHLGSSALAARSAARPDLGPLLPDRHNLLDLPAGFSYHIFSRAGQVMDDGFHVPVLHDGMAAFAGPGGRTILVRNHEVDIGPGRDGAFGSSSELLARIDPAHVYDRGFGSQPALGATTTLVFDTNRQQLDAHYLSLAGTVRNCAGGPTPWNTWLTCEETEQTADDRYRMDHGYVFEVPTTAKIGLVRPQPIKAMGRFVHEAVAVDPHSGVVYLTEDRADSLLYRYVPKKPGRLVAGGRLQALAVHDLPSLRTCNWTGADAAVQKVAIGEPMAVNWLDLDDIESPGLRHRGFSRGAAQFARGEGIWFGNDAIYFACTSGGPNRKGQIWRYRPGAAEGTPQEATAPGTLELFIEPNDQTMLDNADNITIAPWGDLVICEDGPEEQFLVGVTPGGELYRIARNAHSEFAGATFAPDGSTLFVNIQGAGITIAITGPWPGRL